MAAHASQRALVFDSGALIPESWCRLAGDGPIRVFNPGLVQDKNGWLLAYRVVLPDMARRIALCRLNQALQVVRGSQLPLSDFLCFRGESTYPETTRTWFADPRLFRLAGRLFLYWNSGWHEGYNQQFLQELDATHLLTIGFPRALHLLGERQHIEKNWTLFGGGPFYAVYSVTPHHVLHVALDGSRDIACAALVCQAWDITGYAERFGHLRGGAPPHLVDGSYYSFCHSVFGTPGAYRYVPAVYRFSACYPFQPTHAPLCPLELANPFGATTLYARLNPAVGEVVYPCGAVYDEGRWIVSYGINDEHAAIAVLSQSAVCNTLSAVAY